MAESYGPWMNYSRIWFSYSYSISGGTATVTVNAYLQMDDYRSTNGNYVRNWYGSWGSGSEGYYANIQPLQSFLIVTWTGNIALAYGSQTDLGFGANSTHYWGSASAEVYFSLPARPYETPRPPTSPTATRNSDTQAVVTWTRDADSSSGAKPWTGVYIDRWSESSNTWIRVANITTTDTSWTDNGISANNRYRYRISSYNSAGTSTWAQTGYIKTTPSAPNNVVATKIAGGDIQVTWTNTANYHDGFIIYDNGVQIGTVGQGVYSYTHVGPNASVTHQYTIRATTTSPNLQSALSSPSEVVQLQAPPNAPTNVAFTKAVYSKENGYPEIELQWKHNPVDSSVQRKYQIELKVPVGSTWVTLTEITGSLEHSKTGPTNEISLALTDNWAFAPGSYLAHVRTWGAHANPSPYSAITGFDIENDPTATILSPLPSSVITTSRIALDWSYSQAQSRAQQQVQIKLLENGIEVYNRTISGTATTHNINYTLIDGASYSVSLSVTASNGLFTKTPQTISFTVDYAEPAIPQPTGSYNDSNGSNQLSIANPSGAIATEYNRVYRRIDQDENWILLANTPSPVIPAIVDAEWEYMGQYPINTTFNDYLGLTQGTTVYLIEAVSNIPSTARALLAVEADSIYYWVGGGSSYAQTFALPYNITRSEGVEATDSTVHHFDGRSKPVLVTGEMIDHTMELTGTLDPEEIKGSTWHEALKIAMLLGNHSYRDSDGNRLIVQLSGFKHEPFKRNLRKLSFNLLEVDDE